MKKDVPRSYDRMMLQERDSFRAALEARGKRPQKVAYLDPRVECVYEYLAGVGTVETTPQGDRYLVRLINGKLERSPLESAKKEVDFTSDPRVLMGVQAMLYEDHLKIVGSTRVCGSCPTPDVGEIRVPRHRSTLWSLLLAFFGACVVCTAQNDTPLRFEAASIKRVSSDVPMKSSGGPGTDDPTRIAMTRCSVRLMIEASYGVFSHVSGPAWLDSEYSLTATMPPGTTMPQAMEMVKTLLAERFGLVFHIVAKEEAAFELAVSTRGYKNLISPESADALTVEPGRPVQDANGFPLLASGLHWRSLYQDGEVFMTFKDASMAYLASTLSREFSKNSIHITDATGLTGKFDFHFRCAGPLQDRRPGEQPPAQDMRVVSSGLERQLGLTLRPVRTTNNTLIVDHLLRTPTEN